VIMSSAPSSAVSPARTARSGSNAHDRATTAGTRIPSRRTHNGGGNNSVSTSPTSSKKKVFHENDHNDEANNAGTPSDYSASHESLALSIKDNDDSLFEDDDASILVSDSENPEMEMLTNELIKSQSQNGRLNVENKYLLLRMRHQLKESEAANIKVRVNLSGENTDADQM
jgi:hypothetical protein